ncbi:glycoside hydrolase superfamily [Cercophora scortea]|uniref:Glycoside hydrolase superfamily n=1 Tax=Cercophora scortea TaxID=314031 RepID=A0AAE0MDF3_9PEZI|nr:glycoside hydrolase superfamily [Cercophora scortea]
MPPLPHQHVPRVITYYQTHHDRDGAHISVLPLLQQQGIALTHLIVAAIHLNEDPAALTLNDHHPSHPRFIVLWAELRILQAAGIQVLGMLGGAAKGTYARLDADEATFERYYAPLAQLIRDRGLDGLDLDVEEPMSLAGIIRLIDRLRADFGPSFTITLAPVAAALLNAKHNLSGFDYEALEVMRGRDIAFYNTQMYCGWGDCSNPLMYEMIIMKGWAPEKLVIGLVTNPENGSGYVPWEGLSNVLPLLVGRHPRFGGVMGWEYFNSLPGARERPWEWARMMTTLLRGRRALDAAGADGGDGTVEAHHQSGPTAKGDVDAVDEEKEDAPIPREFEYHTDTPEEE